MRLLFLLLMLSAGCAHVKSWASCEAHSAEWKPAVVTVAQDLAAVNFIALIDDLATSIGAPAVKCALLEFQAHAKARETAEGALGAQDAVRAERARIYLEIRK